MCIYLRLITYSYISTQFRALLTKHEWEKDPELVAAICQAAEKLVDVHRKYLKVMLYSTLITYTYTYIYLYLYYIPARIYLT